MLPNSMRPPIPDRPMTGDPERGALPVVERPLGAAVALLAIVVLIAVVVSVVRWVG
jgi:hypothetical protein